MGERRIMITREDVLQFLQYSPDSGLFTWKVPRGKGVKAGMLAGNQSAIGYWVIAVYNKKYYAHRLAWLYVYGEWPVGRVDHINGVTTDNRICNLRDVSHRENLNNMKRHRAGGFVGIKYCKKGNAWQATIRHKKSRHYLGSYKTPEEAQEAYFTAKKDIEEGTFSPPVFPRTKNRNSE